QDSQLVLIVDEERQALGVEDLVLTVLLDAGHVRHRHEAVAHGAHQLGPCEAQSAPGMDHDLDRTVRRGRNLISKLLVRRDHEVAIRQGFGEVQRQALRRSRSSRQPKYGRQRGSHQSSGKASHNVSVPPASYRGKTPGGRGWKSQRSQDAPLPRGRLLHLETRCPFLGATKRKSYWGHKSRRWLPGDPPPGMSPPRKRGPTDPPTPPK